MPLTIGTRIGPYEITGALGAGGMGEVYRATDSKLKRDVAIKVLPEVFVRDAERLARFEREAQMLASLNHPNIAAIYGVEESGEGPCLILELVEGETVAERNDRGPIPVEEAIVLALQVADAVETAHERGIIHRDLKPANIKVTPEGGIKVLDFGLAKVFDDETSGATDISLSPTMTAAATRAGVILGTAAYMSPEQARGKTVDKRADVWAFGAVLYEMLTGARLYRGETVSDTLASVLKTDPDWDLIPADTPSTIRRLLRRCLEKDPKLRLRDIGEARVAIDDVVSGRAVEESKSGEEAVAPRRGLSPALALAAVVIVAAAVGVAAWSLKAAPEPSLRKFEIVVEDLFAPNLAVSPDGGSIAYVDGGQLWIRRLDKLDARPIAGTENASMPFWSPDSAWIGFGADRKLRKVAVAGGESTIISDLPGDLVLGAGASWGEDDRIVFSFGGGALYEVPAAGGDVAVLLEPDPSQGDDHFHEPSHLPDGRGLLFTIHGESNTGTDTIAVLAGGTRKVVLQAEGQSVWHPVYSNTGHILYRRQPSNQGIWALPFSLSTLEPTGEPLLVVPEGNVPSVASDGTLVHVYGVGSGLERLIWVTRDGQIGEAIGQPQPGILFPSLSPDGSRVAVTANENENWDIWVHDVVRATKTRLTFEAGGEWHPTWSPGGDQIAHGLDMAIVLSRVDGTGQPEALAEGEAVHFAPDGKSVTYAHDGESTEGDIWYLSLEDGAQPVAVVQTEADEWAPRISPDGRYIAYHSDESGRDEVYLKRYPSGEGRWQASVKGGRWPVWGGRGDELFYRQGDTMMVVPVKTEPSVSLGTPEELFDGRELGIQLRPRRYDVAPDGQRFVMVQPVDRDDSANNLQVVLNWYAEFTPTN